MTTRHETRLDFVILNHDESLLRLLARDEIPAVKPDRTPVVTAIPAPRVPRPALGDLHAVHIALPQQPAL